MFENIFTTRQEQNPEIDAEKIRTDLVEKENAILKEGTDLLEEAKPEVFKNKAANFFLALSLFIGASTAFAGEQKVDKDLPAMGEEEYSQIRDKGASKNQIANFDWQKIATKIEISIGATKEDVKEQYLESISPWWDLTTDTGIQERGSEFYKGVTLFDVYDYTKVQYDAISHSKNASEFFKNLPAFSMKGSGEGLSEKQKVMMLQDIGYFLENTYNFDMLNSGNFVAVSDNKMFDALRGQVGYGAEVTSGTCGNTHSFLVKTAKSLGFEDAEVWLQGGTSARIATPAHVWVGIVVGRGADRQIVFLDYGTLIPTGTLDYQDALGVAERYHKSVAVLNKFVGDSNELLFPVKSRAQEVAGKAVGIEESADRLGHNLEHGEIEGKGRSLEIKISPEIKEIILGSDSVGIAFFKFEDTQNNPYQALKDLNAWRGRIGASNENVGIDVGATVLNMQIKDLVGGTVSANELVLTLAADYIDKKQLRKKQFEEFVVSWGATLTGAISKQTGAGAKDSKSSITGGQADATFGGRLVVDPNNVGKFYIEASKGYRGELTDYENQKLVIKEAAENFAIGGEVKVFEGNVVNMEIGRSNLDWGESLSFKGGVEGETLKGSFGYEKKSSDYERFIPSSEKIELGVTYKGGPKWEINFIGAKTTEQYKDAQSQDVVTGEVKLRMFLW